ncbi:MAG: hypothetical protein A2909_01150 [Candidatus Tagabacteria bacterium RIFCSPLOWO2_01_FULL_39_11]|uniref:GDYXXLXY domain-containing protein n=1 Tax=Candidatus Tagabacteria bacterium RIFCSPLOWO2_01_FULL_39_11 TaxID=1802295 RepID=A0A1G2LPV3_9BACT|nr:MAG: hypothetical protein A2909_01150 [Candidatus Tagabacteria bacterium RIFCSPLOWO2_01_FULL_39_11]
MITKQTKFIIAIAVQLVIIFAIIIFKISVLTGAVEVLLRIEPVDPRDPLRGDYVTFQYGISNIYSYFFREDETIKNGDTVYVILRERGKYWEAESLQKNKPTGENQIFIKGKVASIGFTGQSNVFPASEQVLPFNSTTSPKQEISVVKERTMLPPMNENINIIYGIEEYFIPEGMGRDFNFFNKEAAGLVALDENGNAALKKIYIDDKPWP